VKAVIFFLFSFVICLTRSEAVKTSLRLHVAENVSLKCWNPCHDTASTLLFIF